MNPCPYPETGVVTLSVHMMVGPLTTGQLISILILKILILIKWPHESWGILQDWDRTGFWCLSKTSQILLKAKQRGGYFKHFHHIFHKKSWIFILRSKPNRNGSLEIWWKLQTFAGLLGKRSNCLHSIECVFMLYIQSMCMRTEGTRYERHDWIVEMR